MSWANIQYRGFYDVPRLFLVNYQNQTVFFSCPFDEKQDEYPETYKVFLLPSLSAEELQGDWEQLASRASQFLGEVPVKDVRFDASKRREIDTAVMDALLGNRGVQTRKKVV